MKLGDKIQIQPTAEGLIRDPVMATVVYIHPQRRYYTAEYRYHPGGERLRESFPLQHRRGEG